MIVLLTDFGLASPYTGQMKAIFAEKAPGRPVVDLMADAPAFDPRASAYLLAAYAPAFPVGSVFCCVVDPGVGSQRRALVAYAKGRSFVGPDNGLLARAIQGDKRPQVLELTCETPLASRSFHGRDLFAPAAAEIACGRRPGRAPFHLRPLEPEEIVGWDWPPSLPEVIYLDVYGNAVTGIQARSLPPDARLAVGGKLLHRAGTFSDVPRGTAFWYENANGLAEIAVNQASAREILRLSIGAQITILPPASEDRAALIRSIH